MPCSLAARAASGWSMLLALSLVTPTASAADPNDVLLAESLYQSGKQLFDAGKFADACPKLAESQKLDPAGGTALLLATCWDRAGKIALASVAYQEALSLARRDRRADREKQAAERLKALEAEVPRLRIALSPEATRYGSLLQVSRDGEPLVGAAIGVDLLVDPGKHVVRATVPDHDPFETTVEVAPRDRKVVTVPALAERSSGARSSVPPSATSADAGASGAGAGAEPPRPASWRPTAAVISASAGVVLLGVGTYFALSARSLGQDADAVCPERACGSAAAVDDSDKAHRNATVATVLMPAGAVALGLGAYFWFSRPTTPAAARWQPVVGPGFAGGAVQGAF